MFYFNLICTMSHQKFFIVRNYVKKIKGLLVCVVYNNHSYFYYALFFSIAFIYLFQITYYK